MMKSKMISISNFRSFLILAMTVIFFTAAFPITSMAATVDTEGGFKVEKTGYGSSLSVAISGYTGTQKEVTLPTKAEFSGKEYDITEVKTEAFAGTGVTSVTIPEGYTAIQTGAFKDLDSLVTVNIPKSMGMISANAFESCDGLKNVNFTEGGSSLRFFNAVFADCTSLESIELPASASAFNNATDANIFYGCTSLEKIEIASGNENFFSDNGMLFKKTSETEATLVAFPFGKSKENLTVPEKAAGLTVTKIGAHCFRNNDVITSVVVPASVNEIKLFAFAECDNLKNIYLLSETAPEFGSKALSDLPAGSVISVANDQALEAVEKAGSEGVFDTANTSVAVGSPAKPDEPKEDEAVVAASLSMGVESDLTTDGKVVFNVNLDESKCLNTLLLKVAFDKKVFSEGSIEANSEIFSSSTVAWKEEGSNLIATIALNHPGNNTGIQCDDTVRAVKIIVPFDSSADGEPSATLLEASCSGITDITKDAVKGTASISCDTATFAVVRLDVNGDGNVDQLDITESQRYYQSKKTDDNWATAKKGDANGDGVVDLEDFIIIFHNIIGK